MTPTRNADARWPLGIVLGFLIVILVNAVLAYIAIHGEDAVVASYNTEHR